MSASRADFLSGPKRRYLDVPCPASGLVARIQSLSEAEMSALEMAEFERDSITDELIRDEDGRLVRREAAIADTRARMIIATLVDDDGKRIFADGDLDLVKEQLDSADSLALYAAIGEHLRAHKRDDAKKNSGTSSSSTPERNSSGECARGRESGADPTSSPPASPPS